MNRTQRRLAERQAKHKTPVRHARAPHAQNRLLLLKNPQRLSDETLLDCRLKLHEHLYFLKQRHDAYDVHYFLHFLMAVRIMGILQEHPQLVQTASDAMQEIGNSESGERRFTKLTALVGLFDDEIGHTSATLLVECNNHAAACGQLTHISAIIGQADHVPNALRRLLSGDTLKAVAQDSGQSQSSLKAACIDLLFHLHAISWGSLNHPIPQTLTEARRHKGAYQTVLDRLKETASDAAGRVARFADLFGCALIDLESIARKAA